MSSIELLDNVAGTLLNRIITDNETLIYEYDVKTNNNLAVGVPKLNRNRKKIKFAEGTTGHPNRGLKQVYGKLD